MAKQEEGTPINLQDKTTVYATDLHKHAKEGEELIVHPIMAEKLIAKNWASKTKSEKATKAAIK